MRARPVSAPIPALMQMLRLCLALMLAPILALTLSHATVARSQGGTIAGWVALCVGDGVVSVAVDGTGAPVSPHLPCPDCIMTGAFVVQTGPAVPPPMQVAGRMVRHAGGWFAALADGVPAVARGPPTFV